MRVSTIQQRLTALRLLMQEHQIDYYYVPGTDAHNNEYVPECWQRRAWVSDFTGSAGDVLIGAEYAYLWTDSRYFLQAEQQLEDDCFSLMKMQQGTATSEILVWLLKHAKGLRVGVDPKLMAAVVAQQWLEVLTTHEIELVAIENNLVDLIWENQPPLESKPITLHPESLAGESASSKLSRLRACMHNQEVKAHIVTLLDAICWLFNLRGQDIEFNPLVVSYALITEGVACIYLDTTVLTKEQRDYFDTINVVVKSYNTVAADWQQIEGPVLIDNSASWWVSQLLLEASVVLAASPITLMKACKNSVEIQGAIHAHQLDAVAMVRFWMWLERSWQGQTEITIADKLEAFRRECSECRGLSFATIAGYAAHGAVIHYKASESSALSVTDASLLLLDSGGQYVSGTTDITRVFHMGEPSAEEKRHYTLVLQGHLALANTIFPAGTTGEHLNAIAHRPIWQACCDFSHGTGHGVGSYLCVHEGPQRISAGYSGVALQPGMILSNEPGLYIENHYGIRIENLCYVSEVCASECSQTGHGPFYQFKDLTLVPYDVHLIEWSLLSPSEVDLINTYHKEVFEVVSTMLSPEEVDWLREKTQPVCC
ncbi:MAG: Xaa-Pro aminopeptidase [Coxiellaceae bacterium]|nr:Xaa-Pro aminopeptidase [Coxiellaceae bacterium]|tara:strand:- start:1380 stop:3173 length:1794 start_codon:yes stop_codon:yes gene_type:complete